MIGEKKYQRETVVEWNKVTVLSNANTSHMIICKSLNKLGNTFSVFVFFEEL